MPQAWLLPTDGSELSLKSIDWLIAHRDDWKVLPDIHLLNVQPALSADIGRFINHAQLQVFHREQGEAALAPAQARLAAAGIAARSHVSVGEAAPTICDFADSRGCSLIAIATHGHGGLVGSLLGSVAMKVVHGSTVPVLLTR
jgi:nucleotide-binding universal stress UspA family protein